MALQPDEKSEIEVEYGILGSAQKVGRDILVNDEQYCDQGLDIQEFSRLFSRIGLDDQSLINKVLFLIFDEDRSGDVDHKELAIGLEMMSNSTYE